MADISAAKKLFSTRLMPRKTPDGPVVQPRFLERARLRLARCNRALGQFPEDNFQKVGDFASLPAIIGSDSRFSVGAQRGAR
jgi:hypothetical protein